MTLGIRLAAYGLAVVFSALVAFAAIVQLLLKLLPEDPESEGSRR